MIKAIREAGIKEDELIILAHMVLGHAANDRAECAAIKKVFGTDIKKYLLVPLNPCSVIPWEQLQHLRRLRVPL